MSLTLLWLPAVKSTVHNNAEAFLMLFGILGGKMYGKRHPWDCHECVVWQAYQTEAEVECTKTSWLAQVMAWGDHHIVGHLKLPFTHGSVCARLHCRDNNVAINFNWHRLWIPLCYNYLSNSWVSETMCSLQFFTGNWN